MDATVATGQTRLPRFLHTLVHTKEFAILLALVIMMVVIAAVNLRFIEWTNLSQVSRQIAFVAIVALGELFVILTGGIDLSVGSVMGQPLVSPRTLPEAKDSIPSVAMKGGIFTWAISVPLIAPMAIPTRIPNATASAGWT